MKILKYFSEGKRVLRNKYLLFFILFFWVWSRTPLPSQDVGSQEYPNEYYSDFESRTLADSVLPVLMPYNRWIDPAGEQIYFGDEKLENHALDCALSPNEKWLAVEGRYSIVIISPVNNKILHHFSTKDYFKKEKSMNTISGIHWQKDGDKYYLYWGVSERRGHAHVIQAEWDGKKIKVARVFNFDAIKPAKTAIPNELLVRVENGTPFMYVVLAGNNKVEKINLKTGEIEWSASAGVVPYGIVYVKGKLYVTNWAGSVPDAADTNVAPAPWSNAMVDPRTGAVREGTVSVIDPASGQRIKEIIVGLHPNDIIASPDENYVYIANSNSDYVSVINTETDQVSENISVRLLKDNNPYFGDSPVGLALSSSGKVLYVANGMDNAIAVINLGKHSCLGSFQNESVINGFIPTGAYPGAVCCYRDSLLFVANIEAEGARISSVSEKSGVRIYNSHRMKASVSTIPLPSDRELQSFTERVKKSNQLFRIALTKKLPRRNALPAPVPARIGEPSVFKHVVYIIKENRTYDQVLGDLKEGDGDSTLCVFGETVTPNTHKICRDFLLLDNFYVSGKCSAEGHQWTDASIVTDYVEKNVRAWFFSYPHVQQDALVYAPTGFLWDNALVHGRSVRIYGEAAVPEFEEKVSWTSIYKGFLKGEPPAFKNKTTIAPVRKILSSTYAGYGGPWLPDVFRAHAFIKELNDYEKMDGDQWPELMVLALPNDHTAGSRPDVPKPSSMVADNDRALGLIVEAITHSRFWKNTVIFVTEDDSQAGWDHVSAYRTVGLVISPYSRLIKTIHTNYNQPSIVRTIEQILGLPPMNIEDATAMPMFDCFKPVPDFSVYTALPSRIPLDEMNKDLSELEGKALYYARKSMEPQFDGIDRGDDELFNHILWYAMKGSNPYPEKYSGTDDD